MWDNFGKDPFARNLMVQTAENVAPGILTCNAELLFLQAFRASRWPSASPSRTKSR